MLPHLFWIWISTISLGERPSSSKTVSKIYSLIFCLYLCPVSIRTYRYLHLFYIEVSLEELQQFVNGLKTSPTILLIE